MDYGPMLIINAASQIAVCAAALSAALKFRKKKMMHRPFYFLSGAFALLCILNILWSAGTIKVSAWDNAFIAPLFNLVLLAVWFYICLAASRQQNLHYFIAFFVMATNTFLLFSDKAFVSDMLVSLMLIGIFFHVGLVSRRYSRRLSLAGMVYSLVLGATSIVSHLVGLEYTSAFWFIPNILLTLLIVGFSRYGSRDPVDPDNTGTGTKGSVHRVPFVIEVFKLGFFICSLSVFMMLGMLGIHEMGHSLTAGVLGCSHDTSYGTDYAVTHVECEEDAGNAKSTALLLSGFVFTVIVSAMMFFVGNDFTRRISFLLLAFSLMIAVDDFIMLGIPESSFIIIGAASAVLIGYGLVLLVKEYEKEYAAQESLADGLTNVLDSALEEERGLLRHGA
ncbi:hypothetical protein KY362_07090 [Candidatus Woesearchaeota archaeon]|nr:hypothetical protein [Candidatus Woesearchaeota archaeon]